LSQFLIKKLERGRKGGGGDNEEIQKEGPTPSKSGKEVSNLLTPKTRPSPLYSVKRGGGRREGIDTCKALGTSVPAGFKFRVKVVGEGVFNRSPRKKTRQQLEKSALSKTCGAREVVPTLDKALL